MIISAKLKQWIQRGKAQRTAALSGEAAARDDDERRSLRAEPSSCGASGEAVKRGPPEGASAEEIAAVPLEVDGVGAPSHAPSSGSVGAEGPRL